VKLDCETHPYGHPEIGNGLISCYFSEHWSRKLVTTCHFFHLVSGFRTKTALWPSKSWKLDFPAPLMKSTESQYHLREKCLSQSKPKNGISGDVQIEFGNQSFAGLRAGLAEHADLRSFSQSVCTNPFLLLRALKIRCFALQLLLIFIPKRSCRQLLVKSQDLLLANVTPTALVASSRYTLTKQCAQGVTKVLGIRKRLLNELRTR
jgi:hypothetical protein